MFLPRVSITHNHYSRPFWNRRYGPKQIYESIYSVGASTMGVSRSMRVIYGGQMLEDIGHDSRVQQMVDYMSSNDRCNAETVEVCQSDGMVFRKGVAPHSGLLKQEKGLADKVLPDPDGSLIPARTCCNGIGN